MELAMWYNISFKRIVSQFVPVRLRKIKLLTYFEVHLAGVSSIFDTWSLFRKDNIYKLSHNVQVCYLRKVLNDAFDASHRRIKIVDGAQYDRFYIYTNAERLPQYLGIKYLRPSTDFEDTGVDFIVLVPRTLVFNFDDMKAIVDFYRLASKRYTIQYE